MGEFLIKTPPGSLSPPGSSEVTLRKHFLAVRLNPGSFYSCAGRKPVRVCPGQCGGPFQQAGAFGQAYWVMKLRKRGGLEV